MRDIKRVRQHGLVAAAGLAFLAVSLAQALGARTSVPMLWRGYVTLVVSGAVPLEGVVARLERRIDASRIVSAVTSTVSITVFSGREEVAVAELGARLDTRDPRLDDYMRKLPAMFRGSMGGSPAHVLYIRTGMAPVFFSLRMGRLLRGLAGEWSIVELTPLRNLLYLLAGLAYVALVVPRGRAPKTAVLLALASLPWLLNCVFGNLTDLLAFYLVFPFCGALLGELRSLWSAGRRPELPDLLEPGISARLATLGAAVAAAAVLEVMLGGVRDVARVFTALAADGVLLFGWLVWDRHRGARGVHRVFVPVAIARGIHRVAGIERPRRLALRSVLASARGLLVTRTAQVLALLALVCLSPFLSYVGRVHPAAAVPVPVRQGAAFSSWDGLGRLWVLSRADELPTMADFVAHEAYQGSLSYGGEYRLPSRDEQVTLRVVRSRTPGPGVVAESRTVLRYSDRWLRETLARAEPGSVGGLLAAQGRAARVRVATGSIEPVQRPEFWKIIVYSAMVTVLLVLGSHYLGPSLFLGGGRPWIIRRGQQEA